MNNVCRCALDIGGTLAKIVFVLNPHNVDDELIPGDKDLDFKTDDERLKLWWRTNPRESIHQSGPSSQEEPFASVQKTCSPNNVIEKVNNEAKSEISITSQLNQNCSIHEKLLLLRFHFFHTKDIDILIASIKAYNIVPPGSILPVTGGGAFRFHQMLKMNLNVQILRLDEMLSAMTGLSFLCRQSNEIYQHDLNLNQRIPMNLKDPIEPFLLVNIGSGVSILKAESPGHFVRVTGTCIGGGTVMGLARLLIGAKSFQEVVVLAEQGSNCLDLNVGDLFGDTAGSRCLPGSTLASSFGRLYVGTDNNPLKLRDIRREDVACSLINMVSYNLGYLAYLIGIIHNIRRVFFAGKYINNHVVTMKAISRAVDFYTQHYYHRRHIDRVIKIPMSTPYHEDLHVLNLNEGIQTQEIDKNDQLQQTSSSSFRLCSTFSASRTQSISFQKSLREIQPAVAQEQQQTLRANDIIVSQSRDQPNSISTERRKQSDPPLLPFPCLENTQLRDFPISSTISVPSLRRSSELESSVLGCLPSQDFTAQLAPFSRSPSSHQEIEQYHRRHIHENPYTEGDKFEVFSLRHDGYLGALGALFLAAENIQNQPRS